MTDRNRNEPLYLNYNATTPLEPSVLAAIQNAFEETWGTDNLARFERLKPEETEMPVYLDYNATTPLEPSVLAAIQNALEEAWGNPSSSYQTGQRAKKIIQAARENVAKMIGAKDSDIVFTSGGTEANNMILQTAVRLYKERRQNDLCWKDLPPLPHFVSSRLEHPAINNVLEHLKDTDQAEVTYADISMETGRVEVESIISAIRHNTIMVTQMLANNETGVIQCVAEITKAVKSLKRKTGETTEILVHTDAAQAMGKIPVDVDRLGVDYLTVVGHKFYGPRIGAVFARDLDAGRTPLYPLLYGGGQERNFRPGTENTGMIAGLGKACELVCQNLAEYSVTMENTRDHLETRLEEVFTAKKLHFNGKFAGSERLPNTCNVSILGDGLEGHKVLSQCQVLQASVGAACHSQNKPLHILLECGIPESVARNALRLSIGRETKLSDIDRVVEDLEKAVKILSSSS